jgi:hypothetical protein
MTDSSRAWEPDWPVTRKRPSRSLSGVSKRTEENEFKLRPKRAERRKRRGASLVHCAEGCSALGRIITTTGAETDGHQTEVEPLLSPAVRG